VLSPLQAAVVAAEEEEQQQRPEEPRVLELVPPQAQALHSEQQPNSQS
jgi:hypothetical protein